LTSTWLDILDQLYEGSWNATLQRFRSPFAFRGASSATHTLASSLVRLAGGRADVRRLEVALLRNFRKYAHGEAARDDSIWSWLALGQHRGLPTRLLDWTYSPLVALHFVTDDPDTFDHDGVVWCVNFVEANKRLPLRLRRILEHEGSDTFTVEMLGKFDTLRDFDALRRDPFAQLKWEIRDKLDQANVNERVLFPGLDGLSRWLARYYTPASERPTAGASAKAEPRKARWGGASAKATASLAEAKRRRGAPRA
jgi:hypothetical protein